MFNYLHTFHLTTYRSNPESYNWQLVLTPSMVLSAYGRAMYRHSLVGLAHRNVNENSLAYCRRNISLIIGKPLPHWPSLQGNVLSRLIIYYCSYMCIRSLPVRVQ